MPVSMVDSLDVYVDDFSKYLRGHFPKGSVGVDHSSVVDEQIGRAQLVGELTCKKAEGVVIRNIDCAEVSITL